MIKNFISILSGILIFYSFFYSEKDSIIKKADLALDMMEYKSAIVNYMKTLSKNPRLPDIRKRIGYAYFQLEKSDDAYRFLKEELTLFPDNGDAYDLLVHVLFESDRIQENYDYLESLDLQIQVDKESLNAGLGDFILGMYFKEIKNYSKATKFFRKALERGHDPIKCYVQLIDIYLIRLEKDTERRSRGLPRDGLGMVILKEAIKACNGTPSEIHFLLGLRYSEQAKTDVRFFAQ